MTMNHTGNVQPAIDREEHTHPFGDAHFGAKMTVSPVPSAYISQKRIDYDVRTDDNPVYVGFNFQGAAAADTNWLLQKITYDGSNRVTLVQVAQDAWDNRTTTTYS